MALKNWCFKEFENFLLACGFEKFPDALGSSFNHYNSPDKRWTTRLDFHGNKEVIRSARIVKNIINNSGIPEALWTKSKKELRKIKKDQKSFWNDVYEIRKKKGLD